MVERETDIQRFTDFVAESRWRFAHTYVESYPHEYTVQRWTDAPDRFWAAVLCIERWGVVERFWSSQRRYLYVDDRKYWHMGDPSSKHAEERPTLINRTWLDVAKYRDDAKLLGYDDQHLDRLVAQWQSLLEKATKGSSAT